jgi:SSS family solute:Na+ symporter
MADNGQRLIITTGVVFALLGLLMTRNPKRQEKKI